jgi:hypothetical protein
MESYTRSNDVVHPNLRCWRVPAMHGCTEPRRGVLRRCTPRPAVALPGRWSEGARERCRCLRRDACRPRWLVGRWGGRMAQLESPHPRSRRACAVGIHQSSPHAPMGRAPTGASPPAVYARAELQRSPAAQNHSVTKEESDLLPCGTVLRCFDDLSIFDGAFHGRCL